MNKSVIAVAALALAFGGACGGGEEEVAAAGNVERYCELSADLDAKGKAAFGALGQNPSSEDVARTFREYVVSVDEELNELVKVAPEEVADDTRVFVESFRTRDVTAQPDPKVQESEKRLQAFEQRECS